MQVYIFSSFSFSCAFFCTSYCALLHNDQLIYFVGSCTNNSGRTTWLLDAPLHQWPWWWQSCGIAFVPDLPVSQFCWSFPIYCLAQSVLLNLTACLYILHFGAIELFHFNIASIVRLNAAWLPLFARSLYFYLPAAAITMMHCLIL
jgi:hypothetical protein